MKPLLIILFLIVRVPLSFADATPIEKQFYRDMIKTVRTSGEFKVAMPDRGDLFFNYKMELDEPKWDAPITNDLT